MIRLKADTILLSDSDGKGALPLDLDDLHGSLARCCRAAGFSDPALPADVLRVICHLIGHSPSRATEGMTLRSVESLICRILSDAGLRSEPCRGLQ